MFTLLYTITSNNIYRRQYLIMAEGTPLSVSIGNTNGAVYIMDLGSLRVDDHKESSLSLIF